MVKIFYLAIVGIIILFNAPVVSAETNWYWLKSDEKYSKYFDPDSVKVTKKANSDSGKDIATEIEAWTKTTYSYEGAAETIKSYGISSVLPDPRALSYSLALFKVNPQTRMIKILIFV